MALWDVGLSTIRRPRHHGRIARPHRGARGARASRLPVAGWHDHQDRWGHLPRPRGLAAGARRRDIRWTFISVFPCQLRPPLNSEAVIRDSRDLDGVPAVRVPSPDTCRGDAPPPRVEASVVHAGNGAADRAGDGAERCRLGARPGCARRSGTWNGCAAGLALASELFGMSGSRRGREAPDGVPATT